MLLRAVSEGWQGLLVVTQGGTFATILWKLLRSSDLRRRTSLAFWQLPDGANDNFEGEALKWQSEFELHGSCGASEWWPPWLLSMAFDQASNSSKLNNHDLVRFYMHFWLMAMAAKCMSKRTRSWMWSLEEPQASSKEMDSQGVIIQKRHMNHEGETQIVTSKLRLQDYDVTSMAEPCQKASEVLRGYRWTEKLPNYRGNAIFGGARGDVGPGPSCHLANDNQAVFFPNA